MKKNVLFSLNFIASIITLLIPVVGYFFLNWDGRLTLISMNLTVIFVALQFAIKSIYHLYINTLHKGITKVSVLQKISSTSFWSFAFAAGLFGIFIFSFLYSFVPFILIETYFYNAYKENLSTFNPSHLEPSVRYSISILIAHGLFSVLSQFVQHIKKVNYTSTTNDYFVVLPPSYYKQKQIHFQLKTMLFIFLGMIVVSFIVNPQKFAFQICMISSFILNSLFVASNYFYPINDEQIYNEDYIKR